MLHGRGTQTSLVCHQHPGGSEAAVAAAAVAAVAVVVAAVVAVAVVVAAVHDCAEV